MEGAVESAGLKPLLNERGCASATPHYEQKESSALDRSDNNAQAQITPEDGVRMAKITPSDETEGLNPPRNKEACTSVPEVETPRTTIMASSEVDSQAQSMQGHDTNGMPASSLTVNDDEVSNLTQQKRSTGVGSVPPCSSTAAQVNKCNAPPINCKPKNNDGGAKRKESSIPAESGKRRTGGEQFFFESRSELEHFFFMRRSGGKMRRPNGAICTCWTGDSTELWLCTDEKVSIFRRHA